MPLQMIFASKWFVAYKAIHQYWLFFFFGYHLLSCTCIQIIPMPFKVFISFKYFITYITSMPLWVFDLQFFWIVIKPWPFYCMFMNLKRMSSQMIYRFKAMITQFTCEGSYNWIFFLFRMLIYYMLKQIWYNGKCFIAFITRKLFFHFSFIFFGFFLFIEFILMNKKPMISSHEISWFRNETINCPFVNKSTHIT